jgi:PAS domain S-box-containing protein
MRSRQLFVYTAGVSAVGVAAIVQALTQLSEVAHPLQWLLFSAQVIAMGRFAVSVASVEATISASDTFFIAGGLMFGPGPAMITLAVDGLLLSRRKGHDWNHVVFNACAPALSLGIATSVFFAISKVPPLAANATPIAPLLAPLLLLTILYFALNSGLVSVAVGLEAGKPARHIWREHFVSLSLSYFAAASTALCLVLVIQQVGIFAVPIILPVLAQFQLTLRSSFGRLEDAKRHVAEMEHEIAERRQAEESLRTSERLNRTLVEHLPHRILVKDRNSIILFCNARYADDAGKLPEDMVGRAALTFRPPGVGERDDIEDREVMKNGTLMDIEAPSWVGSQERWWHTVKVPYRDEHGTVIGIIIVSEDITARRTLEAQYQQAQKMEAIGRLAGGIAHDFNNLLTAILGYCELVRSDLPEGARQSDVNEIQKAALSAAALTRQLLAFSRKQIIEPSIVDLNAVIADLRTMLERLIGEDVKVVMVLQPDLNPVLVDRGQLEQIVMNLAVNARDAMPTGGTLTIETADGRGDTAPSARSAGDPADDQVRLTVSDTGIGMTPEVQARVFEPFFTTKEPGKGTGLGLATIHGIATQNGGSVTVTSEIGRGTRFTVRFPRAAATALSPNESPPAIVTHEIAPTVLVVEDSAQLRELTRRLLHGRGYTVLVAEDAEQASAVFDQNASIDVLLTDVVMPRTSGPELTKRLAERRPSLRVIYMSGYTDETIVQHGILQPGIDFIHKPFTAETLDRKIREVLQR